MIGLCKSYARYMHTGSSQLFFSHKFVIIVYVFLPALQSAKTGIFLISDFSDVFKIHLLFVSGVVIFRDSQTRVLVTMSFKIEIYVFIIIQILVYFKNYF